MSNDKTDFDIEEFLASIRVPSVKDDSSPAEQQLQKTRQDVDLKIKQDTHKTRGWLIVYVGSMAFLWIVFTAIIVLMLGFRFYNFDISDAVMIAFLTTSLGTVLGLLGIGLRFYFKPEK